MMSLVIIGLLVLAVAVGVVAYFAGTRRTAGGGSPDGSGAEPRLEEFGFYPFAVDTDGHVAFNDEAFDEAVLHFLQHRNQRAASSVSRTWCVTPSPARRLAATRSCIKPTTVTPW